MMEYASWRNQRGYIIVRTRSGLFGGPRYSVLQGTRQLGDFRDPIRAELFADSLNEQSLSG